MRGVYFGDYHTVIDWGLILSAKTIDPPTPKIVSINIDGRDGTLDLSRALTGEMKYNNRSASFTFLVTEGSQSERSELIQTIINEIHGRRLQIIEPDYPEYYLIGECTVNSVTNNKAYGSFTVSVDCEPYYYRNNENVRTISLTNTPTEIVLTNSGRLIVTPTIQVNGSVDLVYGNTSVSLSGGTYKLTSLLLNPGATVIKVSGSGTVVFAYREAVL
mgnify:CR=1 FL=1